MGVYEAFQYQYSKRDNCTILCLSYILDCIFAGEAYLSFTINESNEGAASSLSVSILCCNLH